MKPQDIDQDANQTTSNTRRTRSKLVMAAVIVATTSAVALGNGGLDPIGLPPLPGTANFIDWDLPSLTPTNAGQCPSAIGAVTQFPVDQPGGVDPVYYITLCPQSFDDFDRLGPTFVELRSEMHPQPAIWRAWNIGLSPTTSVLDPGLPFELPALTGGVRLSGTSRAFIRTQTEIVRLNLTVNPAVRTRWQDSVLDTDPASQSDIAIVEKSNGYVDVWSAINTATINPGPLTSPPSSLITAAVPPGMLQRLTVSNTSNTATVTRYAVDGGAGLHYLSGVVEFEGKIYFSEGDPVTDPLFNRGNSLGVLDPATGHVHRFSLTKVDPTVSGPRQLSVDRSTRTIWGVTQSGHVFSFKPEGPCGNGLPNSGQMAAYLIPTPGSDPRGVSAAAGLVGFSESGFGGPPNGKRVGLLIPNEQKPITPTQETVAKATFTLTGTQDTVRPDSGTVQGVDKSSPAVSTGQFIETLLPDTGDFPLGVLRDPFGPPGSFYVAVSLGGETNHRMSHVEFITDPNTSPLPGLTTPGLVTGGGTLGTDSSAVVENLIKDPDAWAPGGGAANFGLNVHRKVTGGPIWGNLNYLNKLTGDHVKSKVILEFVVAGNSSTIKGTCSNSKVPLLPCTFELTVQDNGTPGKGQDTFNITGLGFTPNSGYLTGGNIYIHRRR